MNRSLSIEVPAAESYLRLIRMLVTAFAAEAAGLDAEEAARVRLAASEVCVVLLGAVPPGSRPGTVHVGSHVDPDGVHVEVHLAMPAPVRDLDLAVVRALADDVEVRTDGDDRVVEVRVHLDVGGRADVTA